tara:strand:+ start:796 stop:1296 length:501 start_codon:yes stop_codon:yes gene_type:complete
MVSYEKELLLNTTVQINAAMIYKTKNIDGVLVNHLKRSFEGKCGKHGYIIPDTISIIKRSHGKIMVVEVSKIQYDIQYKVKTIYPKVDDEYTCTIDSITKMGIISYLDYKDSTIKDSPLLVILPKDYFKEDQFETYEKNKKINVKVLDSRIKYGSPQIHVVAREIS